MKKCEKCGKVLNDDYVFCPSCGSRLVDMPQGPETCSNCGYEIKKGQVFCPKCGMRLDQSTNPEPVVRAPEPVVRTPQPVARTPQPVARTPEPAARTPQPVVRTPEPVVRTPQPVARTPEPVAKVPQPVVRTPEPVTKAPQPVVRTPEPAAKVPQPVVRTPEPVTKAPQPVVRTPEPAAKAPQPVARTPEPVDRKSRPVVIIPEPDIYSDDEPTLRAPEPTLRAPGTTVYKTPEPSVRTPEPAAYRASEPVQANTGAIPAAPIAAQAANKTLPGNISLNCILKNKKLVAAGVLAILVIVGVALSIYSSPRNLSINSGEEIQAYFNQPEIMFVFADGLVDEVSNEVEWTFDDPTLTTVKDGMITVTYDKDAFNASREASMYGDDNNTFTTNIHGKLKRGLRNWEGDAKVVVSLQEPFYISGMTYVEPAAAKESLFAVTASSEFSSYLYLKSQTNPANDISFIVDKGATELIAVPSDTYEIFEASGQTWYGPEILFGPNTFYSKTEQALTFTQEKNWTMEIGVRIGGNATSKDINSSDFPDSEVEGV